MLCEEKKRKKRGTGTASEGGERHHVLHDVAGRNMRLYICVFVWECVSPSCMTHETRCVLIVVFSLTPQNRAVTTDVLCRTAVTAPRRPELQLHMHDTDVVKLSWA